MTHTATKLLVWVRDVCLPWSNIPFVIILSKIIVLLPNGLPFGIYKNTFMTEPNKRLRITSNLIILLHLAPPLKWIFDQWLYPGSPASPTWQFVLIWYGIILFAVILVFTAHFTLLKGETIFLLNSSLQIEQDFNTKGV